MCERERESSDTSISPDGKPVQTAEVMVTIHAETAAFSHILQIKSTLRAALGFEVCKHVTDCDTDLHNLLVPFSFLRKTKLHDKLLEFPETIKGQKAVKHIYKT